ncbi:phosphoribosylaminoimidazolesuccinocarboxamide synthase [Brevibacterium luteolum]|uniref:phosphoribosylaminoimidazolesuccinocarboxamide synthase n=1 Tax=Brevibacterium luteolum TaxID=199591 RepID=UPI0021AF7FEC|nr:phosphoribosylaminoimidazolesuccinocarboxamide synthase [Brevibacterium luteolum]MCT1873567.1 phosphoribosylaminoimidazolesuccinocarboxamide synthase [Brevibacterium luteolum]MCT1889838.1 phosphoribosylaminoimidazolesuccinocarboxamide synthase [Brevibacterium luteolum]MCT1892443.1 phosphoribosylaminoimidazolesuccinocarboxamide synthase [Brevibacterium luteolum]MCT1923264.1 phosphoribosylaminoimidazolesuccinocarboxamide synthase [Brevibacterium luteolum]
MSTDAPQSLPGWQHVYSGKVRDMYVPADGPAELTGAKRVLLVASDRISAYDYVLDTPIPDKGAVLTGLSLWWFDQLAEVIGNHVTSTDVPEAVAGRAMVCRPLDMFPVECVARGYLTGSGLKDYERTGAVCGVSLPAGLREADKLTPAIFTPATKAELGDHDENISFDKTVELLGEDDAELLRDITLRIYTRAEEIARERRIILADTKFEFGRDSDGRVLLADEVLTPDSSRFWDAEAYVPGQAQASFDKQFVRDWLTSPDSGWDKDSGQQPPALPAEIVAKTRQRYIEAFERITGQEFPG